MLIFFNNWPSFQDQEVRNVWYIVLLDSKKRHSEVRVVTVHPITTPWYTFVTDWGSWDHNWWVWQLREIETSREISDQAPKDHNQLKTSWTPKPFLCWLSNFYQSWDFLLFSWLWAEQFDACTNYTDWYWSNSSLILDKIHVYQFNQLEFEELHLFGKKQLKFNDISYVCKWTRESDGFCTTFPGVSHHEKHQQPFLIL